MNEPTEPQNPLTPKPVSLEGWMELNDPRSEKASLAGRQAMADRERIRGATRMIASGTEAAAVSDEQITAICADVLAFLAQHKISRKSVARSVGYSPGVISEFLSGAYAGSKGEVAIHLDGWLNEESARRARPATTQFVWTEVAKRIQSVAGYCLDYKKIGLVYGPETSGIGKTTALRAIHAELGPRRSTLVTIDKVDANPTGLLRKISEQLFSTDRRMSNTQRSEMIVETLKERSHILLIDQVHNLRGSKGDNPFYILTDLYDATNSAQLWCGTANLLGYLQRQQIRNCDDSLAQIRRRIFPCMDLMEELRQMGGDGGEPLVTIEQVCEMFAKNKLKLTRSAGRFLCAIANQPDSGSVGLCVQIMEYATMMALTQKLTSIDVPILRSALRNGFSLNRTQSLMARMPSENRSGDQAISKAG